MYEELLQRIAEAEHDAAQARYELERMRGRRLVRVAFVIAHILRNPGQVLRLPALLVGALRRLPEPDPPPPLAVDVAAEDVRRIPDEPPPYPHLEVAHLPHPGRYADLTSTAPDDPATWTDSHSGGADLLLIEPGLGTAGADMSELSAALAASREVSAPVVLIADRPEDLRADLLGDVDLVVTDDPATAREAARSHAPDRVLLVDPAVDPGAWNPIGWEREPDGDLLCLVDAAFDLDDLAAIGGLLDDPPVRVAVHRTVGVDPDGLPGPLRRQLAGVVTSDDELAALIRAHRAVIAAPGLHPGPTAFLRYALGVIACGTPLVSPPSGRLTELLPGGLVRVARTEHEARDAVDELVGDADVRERLSVRGRRHVLGRHTTRDRFDAVLEALGIPTAVRPTISVLLPTHRSRFLERAVGNVARQTYPHVQLVVIVHGDGPDRGRLATLTRDLDLPVRIVEAPAAWTLGDCLNEGLTAASGELVAKMDDDDSYGAEHLTDLVVARRYAGADVVGKWAQFVHLESAAVTLARQMSRQERRATHLPGGTFLASRELLRRFGFSRVGTAVDTALWRRLRAAGAVLYSTHRYNYTRWRHDDHTWVRSDEEFLADADGEVLEGYDPSFTDV